MQKTRKGYPILNKYIYANTAACGIMYNDLLDWRRTYDKKFLMLGSNYRIKELELIEGARIAIASFFDCERENVSLVPNFSIGINSLLDGLDKKHIVLLLEDDYPSLNWPFDSKGFTSVYAKVDENLEQNIYKQIKDNGVTVLALSLIQWVNGIKIDIDFLERLKKEFPNLLIIADGTQFCGTVNFSFQSSGIDVLIASAYKWLLAGRGSGFLLFKSSVVSNFSMNTIGFSGVCNVKEARNKISFNKRFEPGHLDGLTFGSLKFSLEYLMSIGIDNIEKRNKDIGVFAKKEFEKLNLLEKAVVRRENHSTIFNIKGGKEIFTSLENHNIICSLRGNGIRLSFHFYNSIDDVKQIVKVVRNKV